MLLATITATTTAARLAVRGQVENRGRLSLPAITRSASVPWLLRRLAAHLPTALGECRPSAAGCQLARARTAVVALAGVCARRRRVLVGRAIDACPVCPWLPSIVEYR